MLQVRVLSDCVDVVKTAVGRKCWALAGVLAVATPVLANPTGEQVMQGSAAFDRHGSTLDIHQHTDRAIIHWQDFSIAADQLTRFLQPGSDSAVLNRVVGGDPSDLFGALEANGQVYLINPNGVLVGAGAVINTQSFIASTLDVTDADFMAGGDLRFTGDADASVVNHGTINAIGGDVFLIARQVENHGTLRAADGTAGLAAGSEVLLTDADGSDGRLYVKASQTSSDTPDGTGVLNAGDIEAVQAELRAAGGNIYALAIRNDGAVRATGITQRDGRVMLTSTGGDIANHGALAAANADGSGGHVTLDAGDTGTTYHHGSINVAGVNNRDGGTAHLLGQRVALLDDATINATGHADGGEVTIGGGYQGDNPDLRNAHRTTIAPDVTIAADGGTGDDQTGDGGRVTVWADDVTRYYGDITARAGQLGGDGGFVETSGHDHLEAHGSVDASAPAGQRGTWLLDPRNVTIVAATAGGSFDAGDPNVFTPTADDATVDAADIEASLDNGTDVTITTGSTGTQDGDITVDADITKSAGGAATFTLQAHRHIHVEDNHQITSVADVLNVTFNADRGGAGGAIIMDTGSGITTNGGDITFGGGNDPATTAAVGVGALTHGIELNTATLDAGAGTIRLTGQGQASAADAASGILLNGTNLTTSDGDIILDGTGGSSGSLANIGVFFSGAAQAQATGTGAIEITGVGGDGPNLSNGINLGTDAVVSTNAGNLTFHGTAGTGGGSLNRGIILNRSTVTAGGAGDLALTGVGGEGIVLSGVSADHLVLDSATGDFTLTADLLDLGDTDSVEIHGSGDLLIQPLNTATTIGIGTGATGTFNLDDDELNVIENGFNSITLGRADSTGDIDLREANFNDPATIRSPGGDLTAPVLLIFFEPLTLEARDIDISDWIDQFESLTVTAGRNLTFSGFIDSWSSDDINFSFGNTTAGTLEMTGSILTGGNVTLTGGNHANTFNLARLPNNVQITGGSADDTFHIGDNLNNLSGTTYNLDGGGGSNSLTVSDADNNAAQSYNITADHVQRSTSGPKTINYDNLQSITLVATAGDATVDSLFLADVTQSLNGSAGANTLNFDGQNATVTDDDSPLEAAGFGDVTYTNFQTRNFTDLDVDPGDEPGDDPEPEPGDFEAGAYTVETIDGRPVLLRTLDDGEQVVVSDQFVQSDELYEGQGEQRRSVTHAAHYLRHQASLLFEHPDDEEDDDDDDDE
ncbi:MAG: filamentous hemagglutinin N-terminal domain-containing protein [Phycisphaeraceae bacterium]